MKVGFPAPIMMVAAIVIVVLIAGSTAVWAQCPASFTTPSYSPDFSNASDQHCLTLNGNSNGTTNTAYPAFVVTNPTPTVATVLRLTPSSIMQYVNTELEVVDGDWATSAWFSTSQPVSSGFSTTFSFQISNPVPYNADGFAFLVQNSTAATYYGTSSSPINALAYGACAVGFGEDPANDAFCAPATGGIPASAAIQFKTYNDGYPANYPNTANSVSIMSAGTGVNCIDYSCVIWANNSLQVAGTVNTSGTSVYLATGSLFSTSWAAGTTILINGSAYTISGVVNSTTLTVTSSTGTLSNVPYSFGAPVAGTVSTSGTTVTWVSGSQFNPSWDSGTQILINGTAYTIYSVASTTSLTLATAPPTLTGVPYSVGIILDDGNVHTVTISYTPTPTQSASPNCFSDSNAPEPCLDVILDGVDLFNGGVYFNLTQLVLVSGTNAYVGFTAGNAGGSDNEDILDWTYTPQAQSQTATVTPTAPATYSYNGGCNPTNTGCSGTGQTNTVSENPASTLTINNLVLTEIPIISGNGTSASANQQACNAIVDANPNFNSAGPLSQTAQCFVYANAYTDSNGNSYDAPVMFAVSCPPSGNCEPNGSFFAAISSYFSWTCPENPPLLAPYCSAGYTSPSSFGNFSSLTSATGLPSISILQGAGPDPNNPCTPATGASAPPLFQTNQVVSYVLGDTSSKPVTAGSGPLTSCLVATYNTPGEIPTATATVNSPPNGIPQGTSVTANYTCTSVSTDHDSILDPSGYPQAGPYLTVSTCTATSGLTAGGGSPTSSSCTPTSPYNSSNPSTYLDTCSTTINLDTSEIGPHTLTVQVEDSALNTAQYQVTYTVVPNTVQVTVGTNPSGLSFSVDGTTYTSTQTLTLLVGSSHTIAATSPQTPTAGTQYTFASWSDSGAISHSITVPSTAATYTASFNTLYQLTTAASPSADGSVTPTSGGYYASGAVFPVAATANLGYLFSNWSTSNGGSFGSASAASTNFTMPSAPTTVTANFAVNNVNVTLQTSPTGLLVSVNGGTPVAAPLTTSLQVGSPLTIATSSPQGSGGTRYTFASWSDGGAISHTTTVPSTATTYTASFSTSYLLTTAASPSGGGTVTPASGNYYAAGTQVSLAETASAGYAFSGWTSSPVSVASASSASTTVTMSAAPETVTANFVSALTVAPSTINFGTVYFDLLYPQFVTLTNKGTTTLTITSATITTPGNALGDYGDLTLCPPLIVKLPASLPAGESCIIGVGILATLNIFSPTASTATLTVTDSASGSPQQVPLSALVINPKVSLSATSLSFGTQTVGTTSAAKSATLTNTGTTPLTLTSLTISGNFALASGTNACVNGENVAAGGNCIVYVTFKPTAKGAQSGSVTIKDNALNSPQSISLSGTGD